MSGPDWCRWYAGKWLTGTFELNLEQRGLYVTVISVILDKGECPADMRWLGRLCMCNAQRARRLVNELIAFGKLEESCGKLRSNRAQTERKVAEKLAQRGQDLANKRWHSKNLTDAGQQCQPQPQLKDSRVSHDKPEPGTETPGGVVEDLDALYYQRGKALLGRKAGGQLTRLRSAAGSVGAALQVIDDAAHKESAAEYVAAVIRNNGSNGRGKREDWYGRRIIERAVRRAAETPEDEPCTGRLEPESRAPVRRG